MHKFILAFLLTIVSVFPAMAAQTGKTLACNKATVAIDKAIANGTVIPMLIGDVPTNDPNVVGIRAIVLADKDNNLYWAQIETMKNGDTMECLMGIATNVKTAKIPSKG